MIAPRFTPLQLEAILDRLVPLIAAPKDYGFLRGVLAIKAENSSSGEFALFVKRVLDEHSKSPEKK